MSWKFIDSGRMAPAAIMAKDEQLLNQLACLNHPILHLYEWAGNCLTYGYFTDPLQHLQFDGLQKHELAMARRPTGGGIIFHLTDFAFSVLVPATSPWFSINTLENYAFVNRLVAQAIGRLSQGTLKPELFVIESNCSSQPCDPFCMVKPTQYDLVLYGKKIGGAAQRRTKQGFLHQGSISLALPPHDLLNDVLKEKRVIEAMQQHTYSFVKANTVEALQEVRQAIKQELIESFCGNN